MIRHLKRLLPQRIASQIAVLVVTSLVLAHVITLTVLFLIPRPSFIDGPRASIIRLTMAARLLDIASNPDARADILRTAQDSIPGLTLREHYSPARRLLDRPIVEDIQTSLGDRFVVYVTRPDDQVVGHPMQVSIQIPSGEVLVASLEPPAGPGGPGLFLIGTLVFLASTIALLSLWTAITLTAPLTHFADAADRYTVGRSDAPLPESGPKEIVRAARALNGMRDRIRRLVDDRARMLAAISHDLRTPITRLRLRAEEIEPEPLRKQVVQDLETMKNLTQSALTFLRDQVTTSHYVTVDVHSVVQTVCDGFSDLGRIVDFAGARYLYVQGDPDQLGRAITNVIENGLKFSTSVNVRLTAGPGDHACIEIQDDGPGIPDSEKQNVLEPFYRGDAARGLDGHDSFGLGLSISRTIVEAHNGTLELHDAQPHGLVVRLTVPRAVLPRSSRGR